MDRLKITPASDRTAALPSGTARIRLLLLTAALALPLCGCKVIIGTLLSLRGRDLTDCDFKRKTDGETFKGKDKKVVVLCSAPDSARAEYGGLDVDIITQVSRGLEESGAKVADSQKVASWMDSHSLDLENVPMVEVAEKFKANYIILIHFQQFSFREPNSPNMYRGKCVGNVGVTKIEEINGEKVPRRIYSTVFNSTYPNNQPMPAGDQDASTFRLDFVHRVGQQIGRLFHDYRPEDAF